MLSPLIAAMLFAAAADSDLRVDVGEVSLSTLPALEQSGPDLPTRAMVARVERILASGACKIRGNTSRRFDIDVPFALRIEPDGRANQVVVSDLGCPELETFTGIIALELANRGHLRAADQGKAVWYGSMLNFNQQ
jgi:hypothetical protein